MLSDPQLGRRSWLEGLLLAYARHFPIARGKLRAVNALWRIAAGHGDSYRLAQLDRGGFVMRCDLEEMLQRQFYFFGTYYLERDLLDCWAELARSASVILDVGANAGIYSLAALAAHPSAQVHAFEPTPEIAAALRETVVANRLHALTVHEAAVHDEPGHVVLQRYRGSDGDNGGMNYVVHDSGAASAERVESVRLDEFSAAHDIQRIDLMKIDIQGAEPSALRGAGRMLEEGRIGAIFIELNWSENVAEPCPATETIDLLRAAGYRFSPPGRHLTFREAGDWLRGFNDIVAQHSSIAGRV